MMGMIAGFVGGNGYGYGYGYGLERGGICVSGDFWAEGI